MAKLFYNWFSKKGGEIEKLKFITSNCERSEIGGIEICNVRSITESKSSICIVAVRDTSSQKDIELCLKELKITNIVFLNDQHYRKLYSYDPTYALLLENSQKIDFSIERNDEQHTYLASLGEKTYKNTYDTEQYLIRRMTRALLNFEVQVAEHCNLNCAGCDHFSPIAKKEFLDENQFLKDMKQLARITGGYVGRIKLLGGEPLLHPNICNILKISRKFFTYAQIEIVSNGILLNTISEEFWNTCEECKIDISVTKYPVNIDFEKIYSKAGEKGVNLSFISDDVEKTLWKLPLDEKGRQDPSENFFRCWRINNCISLDKGRIFSCVIPAHIHHFNNAFDKNIPVTESDYIDIYQVSSVNEILEFCSKPLPFCRYCNVCGETVGYPWRISTKSMDEWV